MTALKQILANTEAHYQRCQSAFDQLQILLDGTQLAPHQWKPAIHHLYDTLARRNSQAQRDYLRALNHQPIPKPIKESPPAPPPEPEPKPNFRDRIVRQSAEIRAAPDGKALTVSVDYSNAFFLARTDWNATSFCRTLCFEDGVVPEEYAYANTHNGKTHSFDRTVFIYYAPEEFMRICQLEIDSQSPHLLDGERLHMLRYK